MGRKIWPANVIYNANENFAKKIIFIQNTSITVLNVYDASKMKLLRKWLLQSTFNSVIIYVRNSTRIMRPPLKNQTCSLISHHDSFIGYHNEKTYLHYTYFRI